MTGARRIAIATIGTLAMVLASARANRRPPHAFADPELHVEPTVRVVHVTAPTGATGSVDVVNTSAGPVSFEGVVPRAGCAATITIPPTGAFALPAGQRRTLTFSCAGSQSAGIDRCTIDAVASDGRVATFEAACEGGAAPSLTASVSALDFGSLGVGSAVTRVVEVTNASAEPVSLLSLVTTDLEGTFEVGLPCPTMDARACDASIAALGPGQTTQLSVWCRPRSPGSKTAALHVATDGGSYLASPVSLMCVGTAASGPVLVTSGTPIDVGLTGDAPVALARLDLANAGTGVVRITNVSLATGGNDWTYVASGACVGSIDTTTPCDLAAGARAALELRFSPVAPGPRPGALVIEYIDSAAKQLSIALGGTGRRPTLELHEPIAPIDLGTVRVGSTSEVAVTLANRGNAPLDDVEASTTPSMTVLAIAPATSIAVLPGAEANVLARCAPTMTGVFDAKHELASPRYDALPPIEIETRCTSTTSPLLARPSTISIGPVPRLEAPPARTVRIESDVPLQIESIAFETTAPQLSLLGPTTGSTPLVVQLAVTPEFDASLANALMVSATTGDTLRVPISGQVVTASYDAPPARSLGTFCVGQPTRPSTVRLTSTGTGVIEVGHPTLAGATSSPFDVSPRLPTTYPATIAVDGAAVVDVTPKRQSTPGVRSDTLTWVTDVDAAPTATTALSATFVASGGAVAPTSLVFAPVQILVPVLNAQTITLQNCDATALRLDAVELRTPFTIDSGSFPIELEPNEIATIAVGFHPTRVGFHQDTMKIVSGQLSSPLEISLAGQATAGDGPTEPVLPEPDPHSFYGCGCGTTTGPDAGPWLLVLVLVPLGRRRDR